MDSIHTIPDQVDSALSLFDGVYPSTNDFDDFEASPDFMETLFGPMLPLEPHIAPSDTTQPEKCTMSNGKAKPNNISHRLLLPRNTSDPTLAPAPLMYAGL